jgi:hypothetical protein
MAAGYRENMRIANPNQSRDQSRRHVRPCAAKTQQFCP